MTRIREETPTLTEVIKTAIEARLTDLHVMVPGEFVSFDALTGKSSVKSSIKRKFEDDKILELPLLANVPVVFPRSSKSIIYIPIKAGDKCMIVFSERSLDAWKKYGGIQDPQDRRKHHLSDAVAIPGLYSFSEGSLLTSNDVDTVLIENDKSRIRLKDSGKIKILNKTTGVELVKVIYDTLTDLEAEPMILNKALFTLLKVQILDMLDLGA